MLLSPIDRRGVHHADMAQTNPKRPEGACVELRSATGGFQVRDSKLEERSPVFDLSGKDLIGLLRTTKA